MLKTFIERPVLSTVISIIIVVLGILGIVTLPVEQYPNVAPPTIQVQAAYAGANADVVMRSVVVPLEEQINGVEGMTYMTSSASNSGTASITVFFETGTDADMAAVNVQNRVSRASPLLPAEVTRAGVTVEKEQSGDILFLSFASESKEYDAQFLQNYANINIIPQLKRINGVGDASVFGARDYSMRIWLKPDVMAAYQITPAEVTAALTDQNIEAAPGELGQDGNQSFQYTLKFTGRLASAEEFGNIILRSQNGQILRMKDVADVELGSLSYVVRSKSNGNDAIVMGISQTSGSNAQEVIKKVIAELEVAEKSYPPGVKMVVNYNANDFLQTSMNKVISTLLEAFVLVFLVVFIFLQDIRSTIIPAVAVPVAIIGTFFFLQVFGFSINLLTLFALVLAIGIVVDDAIVVVEAVHAQMEKGVKNSKEATLKAMGEIAPAIVSITLVMASVFVPVSFIGGTSGVFYKQFGLTLAIAIFISAVNALTLSPALCALFLKPHDEHGHRGFFRRLGDNFNILFDAGTQKYGRSLRFLGKKGNRWITVAIIVISTGVTLFLSNMIPGGFVPDEDSGSVMGFVTMAPGTSLEETDAMVNKVVEIARQQPHVKSVMQMSGMSFMAGQGSSYGSVFIKMDDWSERDMTNTELVAKLKAATDTIKDAQFMFTGLPTLQGFGLAMGVSLELQDRTGGDLIKFNDIVNQFMDKMQASGDVMMMMNIFNPNFPQKEIVADVAKIKAAGLTLSGVMGTLQSYIGSMYVSNFNLYGKQYRVMVQSSPEYRKNASDLEGIYVQTSSGQMAPITEFITLKDVTGPQAINRFNMFTSMGLTIIPNYYAGKSTGDVMQTISRVAGEVLPEGYSYEYSGLSREEANSGSQTYLIFGLCIVFIYLLLAALYESYILPLAVLLSLPMGLMGVYVFIFIAMMSGTGITNNIYVQISLIMLIGLLAKNAILIVEYAVQRRQEGMSIIEAAVTGAVARLRPILMTSFAFIAGLVPLALSTGAGAVGNKSIGIAAIGGMLVGTLIGVLVIPSLYIIFQTIQDKFSKSGMINSNDEVIIKQQG